MKCNTFRLTFALLIYLSFLNQAHEQPSALAAQKISPASSQAEKLVRDTYEKLTMFSRAARQLHQGIFKRNYVDEKDILKFELRKFRTGPVQEIMHALGTEISTWPTGEVVDMVRMIVQENDQSEKIAYRGRWVSGQYSSIYDPKWTVGDLLGFEPARYYDVSSYAA